jgi:hypothetical protein
MMMPGSTKVEQFMVNPEKRDQALQALHRVLTGARKMALEGQPGTQIAEVLDWAELLPRLLALSDDRTKEFRDALEAIAERQPELQHAIAAFDREECARW